MRDLILAFFTVLGTLTGLRLARKYAQRQPEIRIDRPDCGDEVKR
jgi:hypothetical protein